jgi:hypothetical protein
MEDKQLTFRCSLTWQMARAPAAHGACVCMILTECCYLMQGGLRGARLHIGAAATPPAPPPPRPPRSAASCEVLVII